MLLLLLGFPVSNCLVTGYGEGEEREEVSGTLLCTQQYNPCLYLALMVTLQGKYDCLCFILGTVGFSNFSQVVALRLGPCLANSKTCGFPAFLHSGTWLGWDGERPRLSVRGSDNMHLPYSERML